MKLTIAYIVIAWTALAIGLAWAWWAFRREFRDDPPAELLDMLAGDATDQQLNETVDGQGAQIVPFPRSAP
jgi:nitrogen fixation-related uncharacterized protein